MRAAASLVDVHPVGSRVKDREGCAEITQSGGSGPEGGPIGAVHRDMNPVQGHSGNTFLRPGSVPARGIGHRGDRPDGSGFGAHSVDLIGEDQLLETKFQGVIQLVSVAAKELDTVVPRGIVRCGDDKAALRAEFRDEPGHGRRRHHSGQKDLRADGSQARHQRRLEHRPGSARVPSDDEARWSAPRPAEQKARRSGQPERDLRGHGMTVCPSADAVRPEELPGHHGSPVQMDCVFTGLGSGAAGRTASDLPPR